MKNTIEWHKINRELTTYLDICSCQRKLQSIVTILVSIYEKIDIDATEDLTPEELFICALLDKTGIIVHGVNSEYPILGNPTFWSWINEIKNNPCLEDN